MFIPELNVIVVLRTLCHRVGLGWIRGLKTMIFHGVFHGLRKLKKNCHPNHGKTWYKHVQANQTMRFGPPLRHDSYVHVLLYRKHLQNLKPRDSTQNIRKPWAGAMSTGGDTGYLHHVPLDFPSTVTFDAVATELATLAEVKGELPEDQGESQEVFWFDMLRWYQLDLTEETWWNLKMVVVTAWVNDELYPTSNHPIKASNTQRISIHQIHSNTSMSRLNWQPTILDDSEGGF